MNDSQWLYVNHVCAYVYVDGDEDGVDVNVEAKVSSSSRPWMAGMVQRLCYD